MTFKNWSKGRKGDAKPLRLTMSPEFVNRTVTIKLIDDDVPEYSDSKVLRIYMDSREVEVLRKGLDDVLKAFAAEEATS